jgi:hypothetical protein
MGSVLTRRYAAIAAIAAALSVSLPARAAAGDITAVLDPYFSIQTQLADDKLDGLAGHANELAAGAAELGDAAAPVATAARELAASTTLASARTAFEKVTTALTSYAQATKARLGSDIVTAYCPMVKKTWMQKGESLRNPYLGRGMPGCGEVVKRGTS